MRMATTLELAIAAARQGRIQDAAALAARAVSEQPRNPQAYYLSAMCAATSGDVRGAIRHLQNLLALDPANVGARYNLAVLLQESGRIQEALAAYDLLLEAAPDHPTALNNKGVILTALARWTEAIAVFDRSIAAKPDYLDARINRASAYLSAHRLRDALAAFDAIIAMAPSCAPAHVGRGDALLNLRRMQEAVASYDAALKIDPALAAAKEGRRCALDGDRWTESLLSRQAALVAARPDDLPGRFKYACLLGEADRRKEALEHLDFILERDPDFPGAHQQRAMALVDSERPAEAIESLQRHKLQQPEDLETLLLEGHALTLLARWDEAMACYVAACDRALHNGDARFQLGLLRLLLGDFDRGWSDYESRFETDAYWRLSAYDRASISGCATSADPGLLAGRRVLALGEQGVGDVIMFASILPDLLRIASHVTLLVGARLAPLLARSFPDVDVRASTVADAQTPRSYDVRLFLGSLGYAFRRSAVAFPGRPYLRPAEDTRLFWRNAFGPSRDRVIGVSWRGGSQWTRAEGRSLSVNDLAPLLALADARFVSLQHGASAEDLDNLRLLFGDRLIPTPPDLTQNIDDLAALISCLDAVVSVQNTNVHLAGSLGVICHAILPTVPEWRYGLGSSRMPWYDSVGLVRRNAGEPAIEAVRKIAGDLAGRRSAGS